MRMISASIAARLLWRAIIDACVSAFTPAIGGGADSDTVIIGGILFSTPEVRGDGCVGAGCFGMGDRESCVWERPSARVATGESESTGAGERALTGAGARAESIAGAGACDDAAVPPAGAGTVVCEFAEAAGGSHCVSSVSRLICASHRFYAKTPKLWAQRGRMMRVGEGFVRT